MDSDLKKLRLDKSQKAHRDGGSAWPWILLFVLLAGGGVGYWQWQRAHVDITVKPCTCEPREPPPGQRYHIAQRHRLLMPRIASNWPARSWAGGVGGRGDGRQVKKDQVLVRLEDDEYKARVMQEQGQLDAAKARLAELKAGARPRRSPRPPPRWPRPRPTWKRPSATSST